jgi:hypothetical protein
MKLSNCDNCGSQFVRKRSNHKFCRTACRVKSHREVNGISEPDFLKGHSTVGTLKTKPVVLSSPTKRKPIQINQYLNDIEVPQKVELRPTDRERQMLLSNRQYWLSVYQDASRGIMPVFTLIGGGIAASTSDSNTLLSGLIGSFIGYQIDKDIAKGKEYKNEILQEQSLSNVRDIDKRLKELDRIDKEVKTLQKTNVLTSPKNSTKNIKIIGSDTYRKTDIPTLGIKGKYMYLFGDASPGFLMLVSGMPGQGKSTFTVGLAEYLHQNHGKVLYLPYEQQGINIPFKAMLEKYQTSFSIHTAPPRTVNELKPFLLDNNFLIIDSVNYAEFTPEDIEEMRLINPKLSIIGIMQNTKSGEFKGSQKYLHNSDIHIVMESGKAIKKRSRYILNTAETVVDIFSE